MFMNGLPSLVCLEYLSIRSHNEMERGLGDGEFKIKADSITSNTTVAEIYQG